MPVAVKSPVTVNVLPSNVKLDSAFNAPCTPVDVVTLLLPKLAIVAEPEVPELPDEPDEPDVPELPDAPEVPELPDEPAAPPTEKLE